MSTLLLNGDYRPIRVITLRRALNLVLAQKAEMLEASDEEYHSERTAYAVPSVVRLLYMVKVPMRAKLPISRRNVLTRDQYRCAYASRPGAAKEGCRGRADTIDHVLPRSRGGPHKWTNCVAACSPCNSRKNDRLLRELGWELHFKPYAPKGQLFLLLAELTEPSWQPYLGTNKVAIA